MIIYIYAFASMVDPSLSISEQRELIFKKMFFTGSVIPLLLAFLLISFGVFHLAKIIYCWFKSQKAPLQ